MNQRKILIIDDANTPEFIKAIDKLGYERATAINGLDAFSKIGDFKPDIIIIKNILPDLTGLEITQKIKNDVKFKDYHSIPIIIFSENDNVNERIEGFTSGVVGYIRKPFLIAEIIGRIKAFLRQDACTGNNSRNNKRILLVDDELINIEFFDVMLSRLGFKIGTAVDGLDALQKVIEFKPDLILLDGVMPKLTGWQVIKILKNDSKYKSFKYVRIILFTANDSNANKIEAFEDGADDFISKPFVYRDVLARIMVLLQ